MASNGSLNDLFVQGQDQMQGEDDLALNNDADLDNIGMDIE
jgi:hypothetical protein